MNLFGKTAAYTILKNEKKYIETWLYYTQKFDYRVLLDTGSTDGSWEMLQEAAESDPNLIIEQKIFTPWKFNIARNYNLEMIPKDVDWCLSPDMDEYFSINVLKDMNRMLEMRPDVTNMSTTRLDIYSEDVFVGPPNHLPSNKIHRRNDYEWRSPIYEHLIWIHKDKAEVELHLPNVYLVHNQDFKKPERSPLYRTMLAEQYEINPKDCWNSWFLLNDYYKEKDLDNFIIVACDFIRYHTQFDNKYQDVLRELTNIYKNMQLEEQVKKNIETVIVGRSI